MTITLTPLDRPVTDAAGDTRNLNWTPDGTDRTVWIDRGAHRPVRDARNAAHAAALDWRLDSGAADDLVQIVDALVSNSLTYTKPTAAWPCVQLRIAKTGRRITVEVRDPDPTLPIWPTARPMDIATLIDDPTVGPDDTILTHRQGLVDVAGRAELTAHVEQVLSGGYEVASKVVRAQFTAGDSR